MLYKNPARWEGDKKSADQTSSYQIFRHKNHHKKCGVWSLSNHATSPTWSLSLTNVYIIFICISAVIITCGVVVVGVVVVVVRVLCLNVMSEYFYCHIISGWWWWQRKTSWLTRARGQTITDITTLLRVISQSALGYPAAGLRDPEIAPIYSLIFTLRTEESDK